MTNRLTKTLGMALLGITFTACGAVEDAGADDTLATEGKDSFGDVQAALSAMPRARVIDSHADRIPSAIVGHLADAAPGLRAADARSGAASALAAVAPAFRLQAQDLVFKRMTQDEAGNRFLHYGQTKDGIEVLGDGLILQVSEGGQVLGAFGTARDGQASSIGKARISASAAELAATRLASARNTAVDGAARLTYVRDENTGKLHLTQAVRVKGEQADGMPYDATLFIDAGTGALRLEASHIHTAINRAVYHGNNTSTLPGTLRRSEGGAVTNDAHIDQNYDHLGTTYNCYKTVFNRDSYNNAGAQLRSTVHHQVNYVNAFWNGSQMVYGDGDNSTSGMLGKDLDVTVHELTHAVTSSESNLTYSNESGALNEGMSDIFAAVCESWTRPTPWTIDADIWKIGEDIWTPATAGDALRYMANPTQDGSSKDYYPERYTGFSDNGGVHWNSGIANLAFQLLAQGGTHPRGKTTTVVAGIGVEKAGRIFYKANTDLLTASSNFAAAKTATEQAATQLGYDAATLASVTAAWQAVGVGGTVTPPPGTVTALVDGVAVANISASAGEVKYYKLTVPAGQSSVKFTTSGGTGDLDLYVKLGSQPTTTSYDCKSESSSNAETCTINSPAAGDYFVTLSAYAAFSGASLVGDYVITTTPGNVLTNGVATVPYGGASGSMTCFTISVPSGKTSIVFNQATSGTSSGDADLYVRFGSAPTTSTYNCRPYLTGSTESCTISNPSAGTWYACSRGYSAYTNVTMKGTY